MRFLMYLGTHLTAALIPTYLFIAGGTITAVAPQTLRRVRRRAVRSCSAASSPRIRRETQSRTARTESRPPWRPAATATTPYGSTRGLTSARGRRGQRLFSLVHVQPADIGWPTGNGKKLSNSQACCLAQLCLAAA